MGERCSIELLVFGVRKTVRAYSPFRSKTLERSLRPRKYCIVAPIMQGTDRGGDGGAIAYLATPGSVVPTNYTKEEGRKGQKP